METIKPTIAERSLATNMLIQELAKGVPEITYIALSKIADGDVQRECRGNLTTARRAILKEHGLWYVAVRRYGLRLMAAGDATGVGMSSITKMHRESIRGVQRMSAVDTSKLTNDQRIKYHAVASGLGAISVVTQPRAIGKLETAVALKNECLAIGDTLDEFRK